MHNLLRQFSNSQKFKRGKLYLYTKITLMQLKPGEIRDRRTEIKSRLIDEDKQITIFKKSLQIEVFSQKF